MHFIAKPTLLILFAENGYQVQKFAEEAGLTRQTIYNVLRRKSVSPASAKKVCDVMGIAMMDYFEFQCD